jgi:hypothetical protein
VNLLADHSRASGDSVILRTPHQHGTAFQFPDLSSVDELWRRNLRANRQQHELSSIIPTARHEALSRALEFTRKYRDLDLVGRSRDQVVMSGHQPQLFHPGVWYKCFVLSNLASRFGCQPVNLIVDNDLCSVASVAYPATENETAQRRWLAFDRTAAAVPFEERTIADDTVVASFRRRAIEEIRWLKSQPIVAELWPLVVEATKRTRRLGEVISCGRHKFEERIGLNSLEVPVSAIAESDSFAAFAAYILVRLPEFVAIHNDCLSVYRQVHKIRSRSHPVPRLTIDDAWIESPFWVWRKLQPIRRSLFVRRNGSQLALSDRDQFDVRSTERNLASCLAGLPQLGIALRPKALMTTMYSRLIVSDLFLHGMGGAKYDQLTDEITRMFLHVELPEFVTLTATLKLRDVDEKSVSNLLSRCRFRLRDMKYHPENHVTSIDEQTARTIAEKRHWIAQNPGSFGRRERRVAIESCNNLLRERLIGERSSLENELTSLSFQLKNARILGSREYSFCFHDNSIIDVLQNLASIKP